MRSVDHRNITFDIIRHAEATPDAPALLLPDSEISYAALNRLIWTFAQVLHDRGVRAGDTVALTFAEELNLALTMFAVTRLGATVFSIAQSATPIQRKAFAAQAQAKLLLTDRPGQFDSGLPEIQMDLQSLKNVSPRINRDILVVNPVAPWLFVIGSGTTGKPMLMPVTHAQQNARSPMAADWLGITPNDRITSLTHLDFTMSKHRLHEVLWAGASFALFDRNTENPIQMCHQRSLTVLDATVFHVETMLSALPPDATDALASLRMLSMSASTVSDNLRRRIRRHLCSNLLVRYATNETGPIAIAGPSEVFAVSGTVGRPTPGVQIQIVDSSLQPVPVGTIGSIMVRSPGLIEGYFHDENATRRRFQNHWFLPGDLGKLTQDGQLIYCGRTDHMMIMGGINIYPAEIEQVLTGHPAVRDAAAIPVKNTILQDIPVCAVVLSPGADVSEQSLLTYARKRLGVSSPDRVIILAKIPRNERGKLIRAELMQQITIRLGMTG